MNVDRASFDAHPESVRSGLWTRPPLGASPESMRARRPGEPAGDIGRRSWAASADAADTLSRGGGWTAAALTVQAPTGLPVRGSVIVAGSVHGDRFATVGRARARIPTAEATGSTGPARRRLMFHVKRSMEPVTVGAPERPLLSDELRPHFSRGGHLDGAVRVPLSLGPIGGVSRET